MGGKIRCMCVKPSSEREVLAYIRNFKNVDHILLVLHRLVVLFKNTPTKSFAFTQIKVVAHVLMNQTSAHEGKGKTKQCPWHRDEDALPTSMANSSLALR